MAKRRYRMYIGPKRNPMASITIPGRTLKEVEGKTKQFVKHHLKNVEWGFTDAHGFHPIRASKDYDVDKVDETYERSRAKQEAAHRRASAIMAKRKRKK